MQLLIDTIERGWLPDRAVRWCMRRLLDQRVRTQERMGAEGTAALAERLSREPIAVHTRDANQQHYEVPAAFFEQVLGPRLKYSSCYYAAPGWDLGRAEEEMLRKTCAHAQLADGQDILELGCGWGSLSLWMAEQYPAARIVSVSNSRTQREWIEAERDRRGLRNLEVLTADMQAFATDRTFDRVVSVEMFEHMRNYRLLMQRIAGWLRPEGKLFVHIFCHRKYAYLFETEGSANWMGRYFFTGGTMPSQDLLLQFDDDLTLEAFTPINGRHYARTLDDWLMRMDDRRRELRPLFEATYGRRAAGRWWQRWRMFFMACSELFAYGGGDDWFVGHYLFSKPETTTV